MFTPLSFREPLILVSRNESLLQPDKPIALSRLDNLRLALPGKPNVIRTQIENAMARRGFEFKTIFEIDAMNLSIELARQGACDTVISGNERLANEVAWSPVRGMSMTWALCENTARSHSPAIHEGLKLVFKLVDEIVGRGKWLGAVRLDDTAKAVTFKMIDEG
ncbi:LysR substrate-binding domain-containing protein [Paraburkholderia sp. GAS334]|uniref:LysR substrate-binding domain-containing protein n=1 Tax=Paraburkholderia sp. GAS334 TaxID=3035131 RepID=UPI003D237F6C